MLAGDEEIALLLRALTDRDEAAWERAWRVWAPRVAVWVRRHPQFRYTREEEAYFVNRALEKLWRAVTPEKAGRFAAVGTLLQYLKLCVHSSILDELRQPTVATVGPETGDDEEQPEDFPDPGPDVETQVVDDLQRNELWAVVASHTRSDQERVVMEAALVRGLPPRVIAERYGGLFPQAQDVYKIKRNLLERLSRDPRLRNFV